MVVMVADRVTGRGDCDGDNLLLVYKVSSQPGTLYTEHWTNAGLMLGQRPRRWPNIEPALV